MRNKLTRGILILIAIAAGLSSFVVTRMSLVAGEAQTDADAWLAGVDADVAAREEQVRSDVLQLTQVFRDRQLELAFLFDAGAASDQILEQADRISGAHEDMLRAAAGHIIDLRGQLGGQQRRRLMQNCSSEVCGGCAADQSCGSGQGQHMMGGGRGMGHGMGGNCMGTCSALADRLMLTEQQIAQTAQTDPAFAAEVGQLQDNLLVSRQSFAQALEDDQVDRERLHEILDEILNAHRTLDRRVIEHVLTLRETLTVEQQRRLVGLCRGMGQGRRFRGHRGSN